MKKKIVVLLCAFMFWFQIPVHAASITLEDEGIRNAVQRALKSKENAFDLETLKGIEDLNRFPIRNTKSLAEFEYIPNLKKLMLMNSGVGDYTPLKHLNELKSLLITQFKKNDTHFDADVLKNINLNQLGFQNVNVINAERLPKTLRDLSMVNTGLEDGSFLSDYKQLERLIVRDERLDQSTLTLNHPQLHYLTLEALGLTTIPSIDNLKHLIFVNLKNNQLKTVDSLNALPELKELDLSKNMISDLSMIPSSVSDLKAFDQVVEVDVLEQEGMYTFKNPFKWIDGEMIDPDLFSDDITYDKSNHEFALTNLDSINEIRFIKKDLSNGEKMMTGSLKVGRVMKTSPLIPLQPMPKVDLPHVIETTVGNPYSFESLLKEYPEIESITLDRPVDFQKTSREARNLSLVFKTGHVTSYPIEIVIHQDKNETNHPSFKGNELKHTDASKNETKDSSQTKLRNHPNVPKPTTDEVSSLPKTGVSHSHLVSVLFILFGATLLGSYFAYKQSRTNCE